MENLGVIFNKAAPSSFLQRLPPPLLRDSQQRIRARDLEAENHQYVLQLETESKGRTRWSGPSKDPQRGVRYMVPSLGYLGSITEGRWYIIWSQIQGSLGSIIEGIMEGL